MCRERRSVRRVVCGLAALAVLLPGVVLSLSCSQSGVPPPPPPAEEKEDTDLGPRPPETAAAEPARHR